MRLVLVMLLFWPAWVMADTDDFVLGLFRLERCGFMSSSEAAAAERVEECRDILDEVEGIFRVLQREESPEFVAQLERSWLPLKEVYEDSLDDPSRFRDHFTADMIRLGRTEISEVLGDRLPTPPNPVALAVLMEQTATEYIWRAESTMGGGMSASAILDLESMVMDMDRQFTDLRRRYPQDIGLRQAHSRYQFIRGSLLNYNTDTVPYLVDRYATGITANLSRVTRR
jgi:hypothetical protein